MFDLVSQALAQPLGAIGVATTPTVEITNLVTTFIQAVGVALLTAIAAWTRKHLNNKQAQDTILRAAENAVAYAENRLGVKGDQPYSVPVASAIGRMALGYMNTHVAGYAKQLGLDDAGISRIIISKMPDVKDGGIDEGTFNGIAASASGKAPAPVDYGQLLQVFGPMIQQMVAEHAAKAAVPIVKSIPVPEASKPEPQVG